MRQAYVTRFIEGDSGKRIKYRTIIEVPDNHRRSRLPPGECKYCDQLGDGMGPAHDASDGCASGRRDHCTCDGCF
jgi:hypothetical protein